MDLELLTFVSQYPLSIKFLIEFSCDYAPIPNTLGKRMLLKEVIQQVYLLLYFLSIYGYNVYTLCDIISMLMEYDHITDEDLQLFKEYLITITTSNNACHDDTIIDFFDLFINRDTLRIAYLTQWDRKNLYIQSTDLDWWKYTEIEPDSNWHKSWQSLVSHT
jgi:hypothetical protein